MWHRPCKDHSRIHQYLQNKSSACLISILHEIFFYCFKNSMRIEHYHYSLYVFIYINELVFIYISITSTTVVFECRIVCTSAKISNQSSNIISIPFTEISMLSNKSLSSVWYKSIIFVTLICISMYTCFTVGAFISSSTSAWVLVHLIYTSGAIYARITCTFISV